MYSSPVMGRVLRRGTLLPAGSAAPRGRSALLVIADHTPPARMWLLKSDRYLATTSGTTLQSSTNVPWQPRSRQARTAVRSSAVRTVTAVAPSERAHGGKAVLAEVAGLVSVTSGRYMWTSAP